VSRINAPDGLGLWALSKNHGDYLADWSGAKSGYFGVLFSNIWTSKFYKLLWNGMLEIKSIDTFELVS
jgi:hypothetical protein